MPGMTMPFKVADKAVLSERRPGDLIRATLVVADSHGRLENVVRTGEAPLPPDAEIPRPVILAPGDKAPDAALVDQDGRPRRISEWHGRTVAVTSHIHALSASRLLSGHGPALRARPARDREGSRTRRSRRPDLGDFRSGRRHATCPARDATRVGFDPAIWTWLTGTREAVDTLAVPFGVSIIRGDYAATGDRSQSPNGRSRPRSTRGEDLQRERRTPEELLAELRAVDAR